MKTPEELLAKLINFVGEQFKNELVLKGGMLLRLLNSPRATQDVDYAWIQKKKRMLFAQELKESLEKKLGLRTTDVAVNSRGIFLTVLDPAGGEQAKIEINVVPFFHRPPQPMSTALLANRFALKAQIVATMDLAEAFSHKIAATLERYLARDLYDLMQMEPLTAFDEKTLRERLRNLEIKRAKGRDVFLSEVIQMLQKRSENLTKKRIEEELAPLLPRENLAGLDKMIQASISRLIQKLKNLQGFGVE